MGCMKSVVQCVGVIINANALSVYRVHVRGGARGYNGYVRMFAERIASFFCVKTGP